LPDKIEDRIAHFIRIHFLSLGRPPDRPIIKPLILAPFQDFVTEGILLDTALNFKCSSHFMSRFLNRVNLNSWKARAARGPEIDDGECAEFMAKIAAACQHYPNNHMINFESSWRPVQVSDQTIADRGAKVILQYLEGNGQACFTFFTSCSADATKLPLILLAKGKTNLCRRQFGNHPGRNSLVWHSSTEWCKDSLVVDSLHWTRGRFAEDPLCLVMDQFPAHRTEPVLRSAAESSIEIIWVPTGTAGLDQPLNRDPFGALKSKGRPKWRRQFCDNYGVPCTREVAAELLLESWDELSDTVILAGWNFGDNEPLDSDSDDSEDEFELRVDTDCEDVDGDENNEEGSDDPLD
jgi:hypothetical protein